MPCLCLVPLLAWGADSRVVYPPRGAGAERSPGLFSAWPQTNSATAPRTTLARGVDTGTNRARAAAAVRMEALDDKQKLGVGDRVAFRVLEDQEETKVLTVTDAGDLDVPELGLVKAKDKTCRQLAYEIRTRLEQTTYYHATVILGVDQLNKTMSGRRVYVMGEVQHPGPQEIPGGETWTVSKAIMRTGGFTPYAAKNKVRVVRAGPNGAPGKSFTVNVGAIWDKGRTDLDVPVDPEDVIVVPPRGVNFFN